MTDNLTIDQMATGQENKEDTNNDGNGQIDAALTEVLVSDYVAGNITLTALEYKRNIVFKTSNLSVARTLTLAAVKRLAAIDNINGTAILTVTQGSTTIDVAAGGTALIYTDGTANGLVLSGGDGSTQGVSPVEDFIFFPAEGHINPTAAGGSAVLATVATAANQPDVTSLDFNQTTAEHAQLRHIFEDNDLTGNISFQFVWSHAGATTFGVAWHAKGVAISNDDPLGVAFGTARKIEDAGGTTDDHYVSDRTGFVQLADILDGDLVVFDLFRDPTITFDDLDVDARLQGVIMHFWRNNPLDPDWASVSLLAGFDGEDAATDQDDESDNAHVATYQGNAQVDTAQSRFSRASLLCDGTGDSAHFPDGATFELGSGAFTIEGHFRWTADAAAFQILCGKNLSTGNQRSYSLNYDSTSSNVLTLQLSTTGTDGIVKLSFAFVPTLDQWYHIACDFDGTDYWMYVDGVMVVTAGTPITLFNSTAPFGCGGQSDGSFSFNGHIDEVRLTKGVARYNGADFTPLTAPFPRALAA